MLGYKKIRGFLALSASERNIFLRALILLPIIALRVQYTSFKGTFAWLKNTAIPAISSFPSSEQILIQARNTAGLVKQAVLYSPIKGKCLSQSLILWHLLLRQGIKSDLRIGVKKKEDQQPFATHNFNAHAWVECQDEILNEESDVYERFGVFNYSLQPPEEKI